MSLSRRSTTVAALGIAQTLAWGSTFYLPAMLATPIARDLVITPATVFAAFSVALGLSALIGPSAGRAIDRWGGRPVLVATNLVFAAGLAGLSMVQGPVGLFLAWLLLGIGMGAGLYEAAFAALVRLHGREARSLITGITLVAGFASTVGWPLTSWLDGEFGWRGACQVWAVLHLVLGIPLNLSLPRLPAVGADAADDGPAAPPATDAMPATAAASAAARAEERLTTVLLATSFAATWFISTAMAAHLPRLLQAGGASLATAVAVGVLVGPAQVASRLLEFGFLRRVHPLPTARLAALMHPLGGLLFLFAGAPAAAAFAILHGLGNGVLTITRGTLPLMLFGPQGYGARQGLLVLPARIAQASSPWLFGLALDHWGAGAMWLSVAMGLVVLGTLLALRRGVAAVR